LKNSSKNIYEPSIPNITSLQKIFTSLVFIFTLQNQNIKCKKGLTRNKNLFSHKSICVSYCAIFLKSHSKTYKVKNEIYYMIFGVKTLEPKIQILTVLRFTKGIL